jgi:hypothetical protein
VKELAGDGLPDAGAAARDQRHFPGKQSLPKNGHCSNGKRRNGKKVSYWLGLTLIRWQPYFLFYFVTFERITVNMNRPACVNK